MVGRLFSVLKRSLAVSMVLCLITSQGVYAWIGSAANSNTKGHGKIAMDAYNDSRASAFKSAMESAGMTNTLLQYISEQDQASEKAWVAQLDDPENPEAGVPLDIMENSTNDSVQHAAGHIRTLLIQDPRLHNAVELLKNAIYWKTRNNTRAYRNLGNGLHLIQDYFAHLNCGRVGGGEPHGIPSSLKVDNNGDGTPETAIGNIVDSLDWDCHNEHSAGTPYETRVSNEFDVAQWHKDTNWTRNYRYLQSKEMTLKYMNSFMAGTEADFVKSLEQGYVQNGNTSTIYYINLVSKLVVDNANSALCTFDSPWSASATTEGYWGANYVKDGTVGADAVTRWAKFSTPDVDTDDLNDNTTWYYIAPGYYKIYMRWTAFSNRPDAAPLEIKYDGGIDTSKTVNQRVNGGQWNYIGTYKLAATGNYVKILATDAGYTVADAVMFAKTSENYPIASVTSSSSHVGSGWSNANAADGQRSSMLGSNGWSSENSLTTNHTEWITADLGSSKTVSRVDLYPRNDASHIGDSFPINFTIQVSNDNVNWTTKYTAVNYPKPGNTLQSFTFTPQSARYVKITGTNLRTVDSGSYRMQFAEIEVY